MLFILKQSLESDCYRIASDCLGKQHMHCCLVNRTLVLRQKVKPCHSTVACSWVLELGIFSCAEVRL